MSILPPSPFISADVAETLPSESSGTSHCSDGSFNSCGGVEVRHAKTGNMLGSVPGEEMRSPATSFERTTVQGVALEPCAGVTPGPQEAFVIDEDSFLYATDPPPLLFEQDNIEESEIEQILRAIFQKTA